MDFFVIVETNDENFEVYLIDLDDPNPRVSKKPILRYPFSMVNSKKVSAFHVRGSSGKEEIDLNKVLQIFILHGNELWAWRGTEMEKISEKASYYEYLSDEAFFFQEEINYTDKDSKIISNSVIKIVECQYNQYEVKMIYENKDDRVQVHNFGIDTSLKKMIILTSAINKKL
jgi:hypothetical protein